jgi:hypothetical protein
VVGRARCVSRERGDDPGSGVGVSDDGITSYRGIEYARAGRWEVPGPGPSWEGVRRFDRFGSESPQSGLEHMTEDCLFLNVWVPEEIAPDAALPVLVWIHGGGFRAGSGNIEPAGIVQHGVIVVSFNPAHARRQRKRWQRDARGSRLAAGQAAVVARRQAGPVDRVHAALPGRCCTDQK